jgi:hypothetical protein
VTSEAFLDALGTQEEVIVTSREGQRERSVRAWFAVAPPATIYLFAESFALRVARWRTDPWVRLTVPGGGPSIEGKVREVSSAELDDEVIPLIQERWGMWGATTPEGLRRMLRDRSHVLFCVEIP